MLNSIHLHLHDDDDIQLEIEAKNAPIIQHRLQRNINAFQRYIPNVYQTIISSKTRRCSVFCNKDGQLNIVDYGKGRTFYGLNPEAEVLNQCKHYSLSPLKVNFDAEQALAVSPQQLSKHLPVLAVFGIGLGQHIQWLLEQFTIDHLIVYEPDLDFFHCSLSLTDWRGILRNAHSKGTAIYLQLQKDGRDFYADIEELASHNQIEQLFVYKHYNHIIFDQLMTTLSTSSWNEFGKWVCVESQTTPVSNYVAPWTQSLNTENWSAENLDHDRYSRNLRALKEYFPDVYANYESYQPSYWTPVANDVGEVNLRHNVMGAYFCGESPKFDSMSNFDGFAKHPNKDGLVLGYHGEKLKNYEHYQLVVKCDADLKKVEEIKGALPKEIKSMIVFGLGIGYQLSTLISDQHITKNLFICEPNQDFFYASLFALDWELFLTTLNDRKSRLYLNIGDDGSHLVEDLVKQFHNIGPYILANTFFYQGYYNSELVEATARLREQLQVIVAMGDYFDHSFYGINHTRQLINEGVPFLTKNASDKLSAEQKDVPFFVIGNGPSLDDLLPAIQENSPNAILISCGTALQTLHRHGITPDFHAEIEINRSTFDWAVRIGDLDYLKEVSLLSCNGMHPDTASLYKDCFLALKEGESSTVTLTELYPNHNWDILKFAYPTVANFVMNLLSRIGANQIYLFGIDLGFVDPNYHHSKTSGYYTEDGVARFDYNDANNTSITVPGNFRPLVNTKFEFKVSKTVLEQAIPKNADVYNLSDGVRIAGASPLKSDMILIQSSRQAKTKALETITKHCFQQLDKETYNKAWCERYKEDLLVEEFAVFLQHVDTTIHSRDEAEEYIERLRTILVESFRRRKTLLFFLLNSTLNYINSAFTKALNIENDKKMLALFGQLQTHWLAACERLNRLMCNDANGLDFIKSFIQERRKCYLATMQRNHKFSVTVSESDHALLFQDVFRALDLVADIKSSDCDTSVVFGLNPKVSNTKRFARIVDTHAAFNQAVKSQRENEVLVYSASNFLSEGVSPSCNLFNTVLQAILALSAIPTLKIVLPKLMIDTQVQDISDYYNIEDFKGMVAYETHSFIALTLERLAEEHKLTLAGDRLRYLPTLDNECFCLQNMPIQKQVEFKQKLLEKFNSLRVCQ